MSNTIFSITAQWETCKVLAFGGISGTYAPVGTPLGFASRSIFIQNLTDATLWFSNDGVNDKFPLPPSGYFVDDFATNKSQMEGLFMPVGTQIWVRQLSGAPTTGGVYVTSMYGSTNP